MVLQPGLAFAGYIHLRHMVQMEVAAHTPLGEDKALVVVEKAK